LPNTIDEDGVTMQSFPRRWTTVQVRNQAPECGHGYEGLLSDALADFDSSQQEPMQERGAP
jgi:hypothetical protein